MMPAIIFVLFAAAACLALGAMATSWRAYGAAAMSLRQQLADCNPVRELRYVTFTTLVRQENEQIWRPGFRPLAAQMQAHRSHCRPALRAAA